MRIPGRPLDHPDFGRRIFPLALLGSAGWLLYQVWPGTVGYIALIVCQVPFFAAYLTVTALYFWRNWRNPRFYVVIGSMLVGGAGSAALVLWISGPAHG